MKCDVWCASGWGGRALILWSDGSELLVRLEIYHINAVHLHQVTSGDSPIARIKCCRLIFLQTTDTFTFVAVRCLVPYWHFNKTCNIKVHIIWIWPRRQSCQATDHRSRLHFNICNHETAFMATKIIFLMLGNLKLSLWPPKQDVFLTLNKWLVSLNLTRA